MTIDEAILNHKKYSDLAKERKKGKRNQDVIKMQSELEMYHKQIADWLEELKQLRKQTRCYLNSPCEYQNENINISNGWISVEDRLPEDRKTVLVTAYWHETYQVMEASYYGDGLWWCVPFNNCGEHMQKLKPIAWMPLPELPQREG